ncbi:acyltransferase [Cyclobacterium plantarum]|uniref:acyltransferase n=1 Tax=Cyclobacterium plantarum TaxID=2716263 RepID=UPI003F70E363
MANVSGGDAKIIRTKIMKKIKAAWFLIFLYLNANIQRISYGKALRGNRVVISNRGKIVLGDNVSLNSYPDGDLFVTGLITYFDDAEIIIGNNCNLNGTMIHCNISVKIGNYCMFGPGTKIVDNDSHRISIDISERRKPAVRIPICIEDNVWVGMNSLILKGVKIGKNSIVAAHSVVTKEVPENVLVGGNPARIIKQLEG